MEAAHLPPQVTWKARLNDIVDMMKEMSLQTDPQEMVHKYGSRLRTIFPSDGFISLSRRGLAYPRFRITRSTKFKEVIDPWREPHKLPILEGGLLSELIYKGEPQLVTDFCPLPTDPAFEYIQGMRSFAAIPHFDSGEALNMVVQFSKEPNGFSEERFPDAVWMSNLFGRATNSLVLTRRLREALDTLDRELEVVSTIQRSLLPKDLPVIPGISASVSYETSKWAGGDYFDFFDLEDGRWGIMMADVSGHGTPAAVLMAITHAISHQIPGIAAPPGKVLAHVNRELCLRYTSDPVMFITAFYGIYDPKTKVLTYANAGHPPPLVRNSISSISGSISALEASIPLGITPDVSYIDQTHQLRAGDSLCLFTDGITEARQPNGPLYGEVRLAEIIAKSTGDAHAVIDAINKDVNEFVQGAEPNDDRTIMIIQIENA